MVGWAEEGKRSVLDMLMGKTKETSNFAKLILLIKINRKMENDVNNWNKIRLAKIINRNIVRIDKPIKMDAEKIEFLASDRIIDAYISAENADTSPIVSQEFALLFNKAKITEKWEKMHVSSEMPEVIDQSINRCDEQKKNSAALFFSETPAKLANPTPSTANICTGSDIVLCEGRDATCSVETPGIIEDLESIFGPESDFGEGEYEESIQPTCSVSISSHELASRDIQVQLSNIQGSLKNLEEMQKRKRARISDEDIESVQDSLPDAILEEIERIKKESFFKPLKWLPNVQTKLETEKWFWTNRENVKKFYGFWLEPFENEIDEIRFKCFFCYNFKQQRFVKAFKPTREVLGSDLDNFEKAQTSPFAKSNGYIPDGDNGERKWKQFRESLSKHGRTASHDEAVNHFSKDFNERKQMRIETLMKSTSSADATDVILKLVYTEVRTNSAMTNHRTWINLLSSFDVDIGQHHHDKTAAMRMYQSISKELHVRLVTTLMAGSPLSIILDTASDNNQNMYLTILIRFIFDNYPHVMLYKLMNIASEKSEYMMEQLVKQFAVDGLTETIKNNLYGYISDGAAVMRARGGLYGKLDDFITHEHKLTGIHCLAHRLQLAVVKGLRNTRPVSFVEEHLNNLFTFFTNKGTKRKSMLMELVKSRGQKFVEIKGLFPVRWVASELESIKTLLRLWPELHELFQHISVQTSEFEKEQRMRARSYFVSLSHLSFYAIVSFLADIMDVLNRASKAFQVSSSSLIGSGKRISNMLQELESLKEQNGPYLAKFMDSLVCVIEDRISPQLPCQEKNVTDNPNGYNHVLRMYMKSKQGSDYQADFICATNGTKYKNAQINLGQQVGTRFSTADENVVLGISPPIPEFNKNLRKILIDGVCDEIKGYFPSGGLLEDLDLLDPTNLPDSASEVNAHANRVKKLAEYFNYDVHAVYIEFTNIFSAILNDNRVCRLKNKLSAVRFWKLVMDQLGDNFGVEAKKMIHHILVLGIGSADAERAFSILFYVRGKRSARTTAENLDAKLRIRLNAPPVEKISIQPFKQRWLLEEGHYASDSQMRTHGKRIKLDDDDEPLLLDNETEIIGAEGFPMTDKNAYYKDPERESI